MSDRKNASLKKEIGRRFKEFRHFIKKNQDELADELKVCKSNISYIERGMIFPGINLQNYLYSRYHLNLNWLLTGSEEMIISPGNDSKYADFTQLFSHIDENDPRFEQYVELISYMRFQSIEQVIFAKLAELKLIAEEEIKSFFEER